MTRSKMSSSKPRRASKAHKPNPALFQIKSYKQLCEVAREEGGEQLIPFQRSVDKVFATMRKHKGGQDAVPHAERCINNLIHYKILEPHKIGDRKLDPKQLNFKLGLLAAMHSFERSQISMDVLPPEVFSKSRIVVRAHDVLCALRENDLGPQNPTITAQLLKKPSLGLLVWMADLAQCREDSSQKAVDELGRLDGKVFHKHNVGPGSEEYRSLAMAALNIYSQLADALDYRDLSGDLMEMAYFHLQRELHDSVKDSFELTQHHELNTRSLVLDMAIPAIKEELESKGYEVEFHPRKTKNRGKAMAKVHKKLREKGLPITETNVFDEVAELSDRVAFMIEVKKYEGKTVTQSQLERFDEVALIALRAIDLIKPVRYVDPLKLMAGDLDKENLRKARGKDDGIYRNRIKNPKKNGYQALHIDADFGDRNFANLELHIKNTTMHNNSKVGTAAHALYKGGGKLVRRAQKTYCNVLQAIERGATLLMGSAGVRSTINVEVVEKNGSTRRRTVVLKKDAIVADALAEAGIVNFLNGYRLNLPLRPSDKIGSVRRIEVEHTDDHGTLFMGLMNVRVEDATTDSARLAIHSARKEVSKWLRNGRREC